MATRASRRLEVIETRLEPKTLTLRPLNPVIGVEVEGVDLSQPLSEAQFAEIEAAFNAHHVLIFRGQKLSREDHKRFGRRFGRLHVHPYHVKASLPEHARPEHARPEYARPEHARPAEASTPAPDPEILVVKADQTSRFVAGEEWHTDVSCDAEPPMGSMLYLTQAPASGGGDTGFSSTIRAYEALLWSVAAAGRLAEDLASGRGPSPRQRPQIPVRQPRLHHPHRPARSPGERRAVGVPVGPCRAASGVPMPRALGA